MSEAMKRNPITRRAGGGRDEERGRDQPVTKAVMEELHSDGYRVFRAARGAHLTFQDRNIATYSSEADAWRAAAEHSRYGASKAMQRSERRYGANTTAIPNAAVRYIGDAVIRIAYRDRDDYAGTITASGKTWRFEDLHAPPAGLGSGVAYDSSKAYDIMAASAVGFGSYYSSGNRGDDTPDWAPSAAVADAIEEAAGWAQDDKGGYEVRRKK